MVGNNAKCPSKRICIISFLSINEEIKKLSNVLYVPQIKRSLLSIDSIIALGHEVKFTKIGAKFLDSAGKVIGKGERRNNLYELSALTTTTRLGTSKL